MTLTLTSLDNPQIFVTCLSAYNSGYHHGIWLDATLNPEDLHQQVKQMLCASPLAHCDACEEFAITSFENFQGVDMGEYDPLDYVSALANALEEYGAAFALYFQCLGFSDVENAIIAFQDCYVGCFNSAEDYAEHYYEETGILEAIEKAGLDSFYINWQAIARDWECSGDFLFLQESTNEIHVFTNR